ncbi:MAG: ABC-type multidrug transport system permease component [Candidatus Methanohalarchaeum thermophilum]|uniref:ABC-type multidrug transport system permease component n=1 Tax=Methanohalarchaeum thermophilum TaxID=1903181 RepID=A0A1Q6DTM9_METT1|nr:MAG: ABC-type multidrug transport system permease component [Candidatus Methanohalarchaeum thermophilum]
MNNKNQMKKREIHRSKNDFLGDLWANYKRWIMKFLRSPHQVIMNLLNPIIFLVMFTEIFGGVVTGSITSAIGGSEFNYTTFLLPAIAMQVAITTGQGSGIGLVRDIDEWIFEKVMVSPMNKAAVFLGKTFSEISRIAVQILIILGLGIVLGANISTGFLGVIGIILVGMLFSIIFISLTTAIAMKTKDQEAMMSIMMPIMFPLLFLSSAFLPLDIVPGWIQNIARFNPVTYGVDASRALILGKDVSTVLEVNAFTGMWNTIIPAIIVLLVYITIIGSIAIYTIKKETTSEVK